MGKEETVEEVEEQAELEDPMTGLSLQSIIGFTKPKTMKLIGQIVGKEERVLIDSRASSNFISTTTA